MNFCKLREGKYRRRRNTYKLTFCADRRFFVQVALLVQGHLAPAESRNTYLGVLSFVGLLIAILVQLVAGGLSDRSRFPWGRCRPFMAVGTALAIPLLIAAGVAPSYVLLFTFVCLLQVFSNSALGPYQALIRDLVPQLQRGAASGMKWLTEIGGAMGITALVGVFIGLYTSSENLLWVWVSVALLALVLLLGAAVTIPFHQGSVSPSLLCSSQGPRCAPGHESPSGLQMVPRLPILYRYRSCLAASLCPLLP